MKPQKCQGALEAFNERLSSNSSRIIPATLNQELIAGWANST